MGANMIGAGILCPKIVAMNYRQMVAEMGAASVLTREVAHISIDERTRDDAPAVERLAVRAVGPAHARVRIRVEVAAVVQLDFRRVGELVRVHGEVWHCRMGLSVLAIKTK